MKVLWFSLSPCGSLRRKKEQRVIQGWMISLEDEIKKTSDIQLSVAYFSNEERESFSYEGVTYYPMYEKKTANPLIRIIDRKKPMAKRDAAVLPKMLKVVEECSPDIIHIHGTEQSFGLIQDYKKNIPIVFSIQGLIAPYKEKFYSGMPENHVRNHETLAEKFRGISSDFLYRSFCERGLRECHYLQSAQYIFGRTSWDRCITGLLNPHRKYYVVDEIMRQQFYQKQWKKRAFEKKLKVVSTISGGIYKGYETVLRSANLLKDYANFDFEWHIAGYDRQSKWVHLAEKLTGISTTSCNIVLHGRIDADELSSLLIESDIYVHVSHIENSPNSVCEAMLIGMPVIAGFAGGTSSMLENGKEGILVQDGDPYMYAGAIVDLYSDFEKAKTYGENAKQRAMERHNPKRIGEQLINAYKTVRTDFIK